MQDLCGMDVDWSPLKEGEELAQLVVEMFQIRWSGLETFELYTTKGFALEQDGMDIHILRVQTLIQPLFELHRYFFLSAFYLGAMIPGRGLALGVRKYESPPSYTTTHYEPLSRTSCTKTVDPPLHRNSESAAAKKDSNPGAGIPVFDHFFVALWNHSAVIAAIPDHFSGRDIEPGCLVFNQLWIHHLQNLSKLP
ncbi:hypothetical protein K438DRAFT_1773624 [Mycena galopus ATCC 62051]|nr:hypothetical protein K438DRAFT_1773624 [Mycena galopus ATCC 62051]